MVTAHPTVRRMHVAGGVQYKPVVIITGADHKPRWLSADPFTYADKATARNLARIAAHRLAARVASVILQ